MALLSSSSRQNARLLSRTLLNAGREPEPVGAHRETKRRAASAFAELPRGSGPDDHPASVIANYTLARPGEVASLSYVCRDWARAARLWLDSDLATELWRRGRAEIALVGLGFANVLEERSMMLPRRRRRVVPARTASALRERGRGGRRADGSADGSKSKETVLAGAASSRRSAPPRARGTRSSGRGRRSCVGFGCRWPSATRPRGSCASASRG